MSLDRQDLEDIVRNVVLSMQQGAAVTASVSPRTGQEGDLGIFDALDDAVAAASLAQ